MHLTRISRAMATAIAVVAVMASASVASATPFDNVQINDGSVSFGNAWKAGTGATLPGVLDWNLVGGNTMPNLSAGNLYVAPGASGRTFRVEMEVYSDAVGHTLIATNAGLPHMGTGAKPDVFPITLGAVNSTGTHVHLNIQERIAGVWTNLGLPNIQNA